MNRKCHWIPFEKDRITEAARLLVTLRNESIGRILADSPFGESEAVRIIESEFEKNVSEALLLMDNGKIAGYAVATVKEDSMFGNSGWLQPGAFAFRPGYDRAMGELYSRIGKSWLDRGILNHYIFVPAPGGELSGVWTELGFAKQQTHGVLDLRKHRADAPSGRSPDIRIRPARASDAEQITTFSRCIASFQAEGPCFAPVPEAYLEALDKGFAELTEDEEAEILVAETKGVLAGIAVLYPLSSAGFLMPAEGAELSVAAVKPDYRGYGVGTALTHGIFADQLERGRSCLETDWRCANPLSSRFWPRMGFHPIGHRLYRRLDSLCLS